MIVPFLSGEKFEEWKKAKFSTAPNINQVLPGKLLTILLLESNIFFSYFALVFKINISKLILGPSLQIDKTLSDRHVIW